MFQQQIPEIRLRGFYQVFVLFDFVPQRNWAERRWELR